MLGYVILKKYEAAIMEQDNKLLITVSNLYFICMIRAQRIEMILKTMHIGFNDEIREKLGIKQEPWVTLDDFWQLGFRGTLSKIKDNYSKIKEQLPGFDFYELNEVSERRNKLAHSLLVNNMTLEQRLEYLVETEKLFNKWNTYLSGLVANIIKIMSMKFNRDDVGYDEDAINAFYKIVEENQRKMALVRRDVGNNG